MTQLAASKVIAIMLIALLLFGIGGCKTPGSDAQVIEMLREVDSRRIERSIRTLQTFGTRHTLSSTDDPNNGIGAARAWIKSQFDEIASQSGGRLRVEFHETTVEPGERMPRAVSIVNVLATLPGNVGDRVIIVSGHYDSRALDPNDAISSAPGANDNGSGTAAVIELARVMSRHEFEATIVFACFAGEEQGLLGAAALAAHAKEQNWNIAAVLNNDIIGNTVGGNGKRERNRVRLFSEGVPSNETPAQVQSRQSVGGENDGPSRQLARYIKETAREYLPDFEVTLLYRRDRFGRGGDHIPFLRHGVPAVRFTEPNEDYSRQHQNVSMRANGKPYGDLADFVDFGYVARVTRVNLAVLATMASAPASPRGVSIDPSQSYDTELSWRANDEEDLFGYAVLVRDTTSPIWQQRIDIGIATSTTLKGYSKDDFMFAVEAYDRAGHRSVPSYPAVQARAATTNPSTRRE